jgi:hypothetical protein
MFLAERRGNRVDWRSRLNARASRSTTHGSRLPAISRGELQVDVDNRSNLCEGIKEKAPARCRLVAVGYRISDEPDVDSLRSLAALDHVDDYPLTFRQIGEAAAIKAPTHNSCLTGGR